MKLFAIGDLHLSMDPKVEKPMDIFGYKWVGHAEKLKKNFDENIKEDDVIIICGDISWGLKLEEAMADLDWIKSLNGKKLLFKGNHDLWWQSTNRLNKLYDDGSMIFLQNHAAFLDIEDKKIAIAGTRGWICPGTDGFTQQDFKVYNREVLRLEMSLKEAAEANPDEIVGVLHYPPTNDKKQVSDFTELFSKYGVKTCIYGHLHGKEGFKNGIQGILNGVNYKLVSLDYIEAMPLQIL